MTVDFSQLTGAGKISAGGSEGPLSSFFFLGATFLAALFVTMVEVEELCGKIDLVHQSTLLSWFSKLPKWILDAEIEIAKKLIKGRKIYLGS